MPANILEILGVVKEIIDVVAIVVIIWGVAISLVKIVGIEFTGKSEKSKMIRRQSIRAYLGTYILLGLELLIAADIIATIAHPTQGDIIILGVIVIIRTFISYFLGSEIKEANEVIQKDEKAEQ